MWGDWKGEREMLTDLIERKGRLEGKEETVYKREGGQKQMTGLGSGSVNRENSNET